MIAIANEIKLIILTNVHDVFAKVLMCISAPNIIFQLNEILPDFIAQPVIFLLGEIYSIEWVESLSTLAIIMLIIERYYAIKLSIAKRKDVEDDNTAP